MGWNTLPPALICQLLRHLCPEVLSVCEPHMFPWYLGHICRTWRAAFVSSSNIWACLLLNLDSIARSEQPDPVPFKRALEIVQVCMQRSESSALTFAYCTTLPVLYEPGIPNSPAWYSDKILRELLTHSARWQSVDFGLGVDQVSMLRKARRQFPILQSVTIFTHGPDQKNKLKKCFRRLFEHTPMLTRAYLHYPNWRVNWSSMTVLHICNIEPIAKFTRFLRKAENLEELVIFGTQEDICPSIEPVKLSHLGVLYVGTADLLQLFKTPKLQVLTIRHIYDFSPELPSVVARFFKKTKHLRRLSLFIEFPEAAEIIFENMPVVQELYLCGNEAESRLSEFLETSKARDITPTILASGLASSPTRNGTRNTMGQFENADLFEIESSNMQGLCFESVPSLKRWKRHYGQLNF